MTKKKQINKKGKELILVKEVFLGEIELTIYLKKLVVQRIEGN